MDKRILTKVKQIIRDTGRFLRYLPHQRLPIIFANSFPKSGTNLLKQVLSGLASTSDFRLDTRGIILTYNGATGEKRIELQILDDLKGSFPGEICWGHLHATHGIKEHLLQENIINLFIFRDPRDVVVSHAYYVSDLTNKHAHNEYYLGELKSMEERITTSILGLPKSRLEFPDIGKRFEPYRAWLTYPEVLKIKFEDLIINQDQTLIRLLDHIENRGYPLNKSRGQTLTSMRAAIDPTTSRTFRKGTVGDWKNHFTEKHKEIFKSVAGDLLIELGYEENLEW